MSDSVSRQLANELAKANGYWSIMALPQEGRSKYLTRAEALTKLCGEEHVAAVLAVFEGKQLSGWAQEVEALPSLPEC